MMAITIFVVAIGLCEMFMSGTQAESMGSDRCCPSFWTPFGESCYRLISKRESWPDAEIQCQQLGNDVRDMAGHLVSIQTKEENVFVQNYYESGAVIVSAGRRKKQIKPATSNAFWLGLNRHNERADLDTFVWSDNKTEMSYNFWQNIQFERKNECGHMWTWPSDYKGTWDDTSCRTKLPYMCKLQDDSDAGRRNMYRSELPCSFRGNIILHGNTLKVDDCTVCGCNNSTVKCDISSCQPVFCHVAVILEGECCDICPYNVPVYDIELVGVSSVKSGAVNDMSVDLHVAVNREGVGVSGSHLWKLRMWASRNALGTGNKIGFTEQVLNDEQASTDLVRPPIFGGFEFSIANIDFSLDASDASCEEIKYLCASFNIGEEPETPSSLVLFDVYGVENELNATRNPTKLVGCQPFTHCNNPGSCSYRGIHISHGDTLILDPCTNCSCDDTTVKCDIKSCRPTLCEEPVSLETECCDICPYNPMNCSYRGTTFSHGDTWNIDKCTNCSCNDSTIKCDIKNCRPTFCADPVSPDGTCCGICPYSVPVSDIELVGVSSVQSGSVNDMRVDLNVAVNENGQSVNGRHLWKLDMWASSNALGTGEKIGFIEQVLTDEQASTEMVRPPLFVGFQFSIPNIDFSLDASDASCVEIRYLCAEFNMGDAPETEWPSNILKFDVYGVEAELDAKRKPAKLVGCQPFSHCDNPRNCGYRGMHISHGNTVALDVCTSCSCDDSTVRCDIKSCQPSFCQEPFTPEGECCDICPYNVPVYSIEIAGLRSVQSGAVNDVSVDLHVAVNRYGVGVSGSDLWKVGMWASGNAHGTGKKTGFTEQVLSEEQASTTLSRPPVVSGFEFVIPDIEFSFDASDAPCNEIGYLCASFNMGDAPETEREFPFTVFGVVAERDSTSNPTSLVGCQRFLSCTL